MKKPIYVWPFILIYLMVSYIAKTFMYFLFGIYYSLYSIIKYNIYGVIFLIEKFIKAIPILCLGFIYILKPIYQSLFKILMYISYVVYKVPKYVLLSIIYIWLLGYRKIKASILNYMAQAPERAKKKLERQKQKEAEDKKRLEKKKALIEKKKAEKELQASKRKKNKDVYVNENAVIEKKTFGDRINDTLEKIVKIPDKIKKNLGKSISNSSFVKNIRNQRDIKSQALLIDFEGADAEKSDIKLMYRYRAKTPEGKVVTNYFEAFSKVEVHSFLLSEGYEVYEIKTSPLIRFVHGKSNVNKDKVKNKDLIFFLTQLSTYIKAGIPLVDALKILARQYKKKSYQRIFRTMIYDLTMGENFSDALAKQGNAFPRILINMVKAAELTGELPETLDNMAEYFTETEKTRKQMITAMMYPSIVFIIAIAVITFILLYVIPQFTSIYASMEANKIPELTKIVIMVSDFLKANILKMFLGLVVFVLVMIYLYRNVRIIRTMFQFTLMHIPVIKNIIIYNEVTNFTKTFATLLSHNVFITDSMEILNKITNNEIYKMIILDTISNLAKGEKISAAFNTWSFPVMAYEMIVTGEQTGQLAEMMAKVADYYQDMHKNAVTRIKTFIEPILIVFLTVMVGIIVLAIVIPMFELYSSVQNQY